MIELFKIWPSKFKVKVMIQGHIVGITSYRLAFPFFHVDWPSRSWDRAISNIDLQNPRSMAWVRSKFKSQCESNILSTHISFVPCWSALPFLSYDFFKIWPLKWSVKVMGSKSQCGCNILWTHIPFVPCQSALPFLRYSIFKIWPWKSKVEVIAHGHKVGITPYRLISPSFRVDWHSCSWDTANSKFDLENPMSRS